MVLTGLPSLCSCAKARTCAPSMQGRAGHSRSDGWQASGGRWRGRWRSMHVPGSTCIRVLPALHAAGYTSHAHCR